MRIHALLLFGASLALSSHGRAGAGQRRRSVQPREPQREGAGDLQGEVRHQQRRFVVEVHRDWAPNGADRFYNLVKNGFYNDTRFFRVISGFMVQFGINGDPKLSQVWRDANIKDDPVKASNKRGNITFATAGPDTRTTQVFINFGNNAGLDDQGFAPFGQVISGMEVVDALYADYGEGAPRGDGPDQGLVQSQGNAYLKKDFPKLDYIKTATIEP